MKEEENIFDLARREQGTSGISGNRVTPPAPDGEARPGDQIGPYKLIEQLGEGGFGVVFLADQQEPVKRRAALKILKPGMDSKRILARFEIERQALALMNHPNVAKVLDAGVSERGRPFFVMELVKGAPITKFCDEERLDTTQRLKLFLQVCAAVQHAHQKGIIHRDLKPSNILVGIDGSHYVPKVIDFGIAKATQQPLTDKTISTRSGDFLGTPVYISPEQANLNAVDIDVRSDIYSLGVLLYELLTGQLPIDRKTLFADGMEGVRKIIREKETPRPSTRVSTASEEEIKLIAAARRTEPARLGRFLRGDLDWIILRALEKERSRRYASVERLIEDLERYLQHEPVSATPPSTIYRMRKLVQRHRAVVASLATIAATLVIATVVSVWQAVEARNAEAEALNAKGVAEVERMKSDRSVLMIGDAYQSATDLAADMLVAGQSELAQTSADDARRAIVAVLGKQAHTAAAFYDGNSISGDDEGSLHMKAIVTNSEGYLAWRLNHLDEARRLYEEALQIRKDLLRRTPSKALYLHNLAVSYDNLGDVDVKMGRQASGPDAGHFYSKGLKSYRKGLALAKKLRSLPEAASYWRHDVAVSHFKIADTLYEMEKAVGEGDVEPALQEFALGFPIARTLANKNPEYPKWQILYGRYCLRRAQLFLSRGRLEEALESFRAGEKAFAAMRATGGFAEALDGFERDLQVAEQAKGRATPHRTAPQE